VIAMQVRDARLSSPPDVTLPPAAPCIRSAFATARRRTAQKEHLGK
jgi:hypothetical protein